MFICVCPRYHYILDCFFIFLDENRDEVGIIFPAHVKLFSILLHPSLCSPLFFLGVVFFLISIFDCWETSALGTYRISAKKT